MTAAEPTVDERIDVVLTLWRLIEMIDRGEVEGKAWYRERLVGAAVALAPCRPDS